MTQYTIDFAKLKVLIVDDQKLFREAVGFELEMLGCQVILAEDGERGYQEAIKEPFDLIISDIRMPNWDGKRFLEEFRKRDKSKPPFVFMTGFADISPQLAYSMGADAFLGKPLNPEQLESVLNKLLTPIDKRLAAIPNANPKFTFSKNFATADEATIFNEFRLGRGGFFLKESGELKKARVGDLVKFDLAFHGGSIKRLVGSGRLAWLRSDENSTHLAGYGIEIDTLDQASAKDFLEEMSRSIPVAFIPLGEA